MSREEKELLYEIASWHSKRFYNDMEDHWSEANYRLADKCRYKLDTLEREYIEKYGSLPQWRYINDVWQTMRELKEELDG
jgi:hypothetical protein